MPEGVGTGMPGNFPCDVNGDAEDGEGSEEKDGIKVTLSSLSDNFEGSVLTEDTNLEGRNGRNKQNNIFDLMKTGALEEDKNGDVPGRSTLRLASGPRDADYVVLMLNARQRQDQEIGMLIDRLKENGVSCLFMKNGIVGGNNASPLKSPSPTPTLRVTNSNVLQSPPRKVQSSLNGKLKSERERVGRNGVKHDPFDYANASSSVFDQLTVVTGCESFKSTETPNHLVRLSPKLLESEKKSSNLENDNKILLPQTAALNLSPSDKRRRKRSHNTSSDPLEETVKNERLPFELPGESVETKSLETDKTTPSNHQANIPVPLKKKRKRRRKYPYPVRKPVRKKKKVDILPAEPSELDEEQTLVKKVMPLVKIKPLCVQTIPRKRKMKSLIKSSPRKSKRAHFQQQNISPIFSSTSEENDPYAFIPDDAELNSPPPSLLFSPKPLGRKNLTSPVYDAVSAAHSASVNTSLKEVSSSVQNSQIEDTASLDKVNESSQNLASTITATSKPLDSYAVKESSGDKCNSDLGSSDEASKPKKRKKRTNEVCQLLTWAISQRPSTPRSTTNTFFQKAMLSQSQTDVQSQEKSKDEELQTENNNVTENVKELQECQDQSITEPKPEETVKQPDENDIVTPIVEESSKSSVPEIETQTKPEIEKFRKVVPLIRKGRLKSKKRKRKQLLKKQPRSVIRKIVEDIPSISENTEKIKVKLETEDEKKVDRVSLSEDFENGDTDALSVTPIDDAQLESIIEDIEQSLLPETEEPVSEKMCLKVSEQSETKAKVLESKVVKIEDVTDKKEDLSQPHASGFHSHQSAPETDHQIVKPSGTDLAPKPSTSAIATTSSGHDAMRLRRPAFQMFGFIGSAFQNFLDGRMSQPPESLTSKPKRRKKPPRPSFLLHHGLHHELHLATQIILKLNKPRAKFKPKEEKGKTLLSYLRLMPNRVRSRGNSKYQQQTPTESNKDSVKEEEEFMKQVFSGEWTQPRKYICNICGHAETSFWEMVHHKGDSHIGVVVTHVELQDMPPQGFRTLPALPSSSSSNISQSLACTKCKTTFSVIGDLHRHIFECSGKINELEEPKEEPQTPRRKRRRKRGFNSFYKRRTSNTPRKSNTSPTKRRNTDIDCLFCDKKFKTDGWLRNHIASHSLPISIPLSKLNRTLPKRASGRNLKT